MRKIEWDVVENLGKSFANCLQQGVCGNERNPFTSLFLVVLTFPFLVFPSEYEYG
jgi:hypothetical protein